MDKKFLYQLLLTALVAGVISFLVSSPFVEANFFKEFWEKYFSPQTPAAPASERVVERIIEKSVPYEAKDVHEEAVIKAVEEASPSVVSIVISKDLPVYEQCAFDPLGDLPLEFREFFGDGLNFTRPCPKGTKRQEVGGGSGFLISADGLVLTNRHVVNDLKADYTVLTNDGKKYPAKVLARSPVQDLAVVKIQGSAGPAGFKPLKLGNSDSLRLGQTVIAIGNALAEFRNTVSVGVISGLSRKIVASDSSGAREQLEGLIQTDAAINPGNSGGPLINLRGEVVGVDTAIAAGAQNVGFAIPINKVKRDIQSVKATGKISVPYLGVRYILLTEETAEREKLEINYGALLRGNDNGPAVAKSSPAERAGLLAEDIILEVNGVKVDENNSLGALIQKYQVGDQVKLRVFRSGRELEIAVDLEERKE